jgi:signal transduction histidine kinase
MDVTKDERFRSCDVLEALSDVRFYATVPLVSPRGFTIGAYSVMDSEVRTSGPDQHALQFMNEMAATVMDHLVIVHNTRKSREAELRIVGLDSFIEGKSTLRDSWTEANAQFAASEQSGEATEGQLNIVQQRLQEVAKDKDQTSLVFRDSFGRAEETSSHPSNSSSSSSSRGAERSQRPGIVLSSENSVRTVLAGESLQDDSLSTSIKLVFSRAANLIRESLGAEGVMFLDANSDRFGSLVNRTSRKVSSSSKYRTSGSDESTASESSSSHEFSSESERKFVSECLGFSSSQTSSINDEPRTGRTVVVPEPLFSSLVRRYPRGKIFSYSDNGLASEDSNETYQNKPGPMHRGTTDNAYHTDERRSSSKKRNKPTFQQDADHLIKIFPEARNILFLPIWDSGKRRCFAGTLVWTNSPEHVFTSENELVFASAFANSIMAEIYRLDVEAAEKANSKLVTSITHELRTPLHGILGTADILSDTAMNATQYGMIHTIESCGRTLLDTINNLLDVTFIDKYQKKPSRLVPGEKQVDLPASSAERARMQSKGRVEKASSSHVKLDAVLEEVTESVFAGYSFYPHPHAPPPALTDYSSRSAGPASASDQVGPQASQVTIIFDIQPDTTWDFDTHPGAWRRILMNVLGNALKYTSSGYIYVGLASCQSCTSQSQKGPVNQSLGEQNQEFEVTLTVKDTGKGIGPEYLQNDLFTPFMQEDPLASGSGLGLSIVRQAVNSLGGSIEINSTKGVGTELTIRTPLTRFPDTSDISSSDSLFNSLQTFVQGKKIGFLGFGFPLRSHRDTALYSSLERLCRDWFDLKVTSVSLLKDEPVPFDFYLAVQTELDSEDVEGSNIYALNKHLDGGNGCSPPVVVICQSPEEAHSMFVAANNRDETPIFEFISQPCGPRKLARTLSLCMKRQLNQQSGRPSPEELTRWVEMPESSHLPLDLESSDPPQERMKISKRPTTDAILGPEYRSPPSMSSENSREVDTQIIARPTSAFKEGQGNPEPPSPSVLLVDDNDLNLRLLCAYTRKGNYDYMTAQNGADAVATYEAHPGKFRVVILGMFGAPSFLHF